MNEVSLPFKLYFQNKHRATLLVKIYFVPGKASSSNAGGGRRDHSKVSLGHKES